ncbi:MAG: hypothetical protein KC646_12675 [Candidatus Cloacimonetes bacterium]|nr:hypothetical protein [Candidatus Cloacimonadota bacterium]
MTNQVIKVCHLLDQTLANRVGGVEFINHLLFQNDNNKQFDHQIRDANSFQKFEPYHLSTHFKVDTLEGTQSADIVHIHQIQPYGLRSLVHLAQQKDTILTIHDYYLFCQKSTFYRENKDLCQKGSSLKCTVCNAHNMKSVLLPLFFLLRTELTKQLLKHVKKIVLPNHDLLSLIPKEFQKKCITIHYATPLTAERPSVKQHFAYLGTLAPHKGIYQLIQDLQNYNFEGQLHVYSPNSFSKEVPPFVKHCGLLKNKAKLNTYKALLIPSKWKETGPIVLQEALNANTEVILYKSLISKDYSNLNGVHIFDSIQQIKDFVASPFVNNSYSFLRSKKSLESLYTSIVR